MYVKSISKSKFSNVEVELFDEIEYLNISVKNIYTKSLHSRYLLINAQTDSFYPTLSYLSHNILMIYS